MINIKQNYLGKTIIKEISPNVLICQRLKLKTDSYTK